MARKIADSATMGIEPQAWIDALASASKKHDVGMSSNELAEVWGVTVKTAVDRIKRLHRMGWVKVGQRDGMSISGRRCVFPVYAIAAPTKAKKK